MANTNRSIADVLGIGQIEPGVGQSSRVNVGEAERLASAAGGALLVSYGLSKFSLSGLLLAAAGGGLLYRGLSGYCPMNNAIGRNTAEGEDEKITGPIEITKSMTINRPRAEVYKYWRQLENLPRFMSHLKEVKQYDPKHSHWVAQVADNKVAQILGTIEWDAEIIDEVENERLAWKSVEGASIDNAGSINFVDGPNGEGTEVLVTIQYRPPAGQLGELAMKLFNPTFKQMIKKDIAGFKQIMETGSLAPKGNPVPLPH